MTYKSTDARDLKMAAEWLKKHWGKSDNSEYYDARSLNEAAELLKEYGKEASIIAGGTDLLGLIKNRVKSPHVFVNLKTIEGLNEINLDQDGMTIGTLTSIDGLQRSRLVRENYPLLQQTACAIASPHIRNMASIGGNLLQDVRCWYYRRSPDTGITYDCRRKNPSGQCFAADGENQYHAIAGASRCFAVLGSDLATTLLALDARVLTVSTSGQRSLALDELYAPLGHTLAHDEVIQGIWLPTPEPGIKQHFLKFRVRKTIDFAIVSVAVNIRLENGRVKNAQIVLGGIAHKPWRAEKAEAIMIGEKIEEKAADEAGRIALDGALPLKKNAYKMTLARVLVKRAILGESL